MPRSLVALVVSTTSSLVAAVMATIANGPRPAVTIMWACWAGLALATVTLVVNDRRRRA